MCRSHLDLPLWKSRRRYGLGLRVLKFHWDGHRHQSVPTDAARQLLSSPLEDADGHALVALNEFGKRYPKL